MSFCNVIPAWALMPVRVVGRDTRNRLVQRGFMTRDEATWFIHNEGDHLYEYIILDDTKKGK